MHIRTAKKSKNNFKMVYFYHTDLKYQIIFLYFELFLQFISFHICLIINYNRIVISQPAKLTI